MLRDARRFLGSRAQGFLGVPGDSGVRSALCVPCVMCLLCVRLSELSLFCVLALLLAGLSCVLRYVICDFCF